ncbi:hypothetical protein F441_18487 [Phytophthora nicotianae CJ01A1]|uniref:Uncharacterized protein n=3 Tax=Phytophthora nicotianae TaxID=4792 RepID=W2P834_PHYN3|nr:hypothetical protein PPTG_25048 [Phytophthora nicotianae INRA-310]ETM97162.1 hypothetical protein PPTG_25048 [Phytophthora nicotianae INRA-310]ETP04817.1 hypothetical protein F441_18487 [Phytophthora nicotianae CJ01A1]ETP32979.1 hypothetical protein F442_18424 [Phytophthora nicotianae P10297]
MTGEAHHYVARTLTKFSASSRLASVEEELGKNWPKNWMEVFLSSPQVVFAPVFFPEW